MNKKEVPIWEKSNLTLEEAAAYSGIGINKLRDLSNREDCEFVLWVGSKRLIKREPLKEYLSEVQNDDEVLVEGLKGHLYIDNKQGEPTLTTLKTDKKGQAKVTIQPNGGVILK